MSTLEAPSKSFLVCTWEGGGSVAPMMTLVEKLMARGHRVRVMSDACNRPECEVAGAPFTPWTRAPSRTDRTRETDPARDWEAASPPEALMRWFDAVFTGRALDYARDVIAELEREPADLVVTFEALFGVAAGCEALGQPYAVFGPNISLLPMPGVPPLGHGLLPATTDEERARHAEAAAMTAGLFDYGLPALNAARAALGLAPIAHLADQMKTAVATLLGTARAFDFAPEVMPAGFHYVGPQLGEPAWADPVAAAGDDPRPLVVISFSTTYQGHGGVVQRVVDALADLPARGVVTLSSLRADEITAPPNVQVVASARHDALMREAALVVTHGGHGTVARALAHRCPLLVMPHGRDQLDNGVRVVARNAGLMLMPDASTDEIRGALSRLLAEAGFKEGAARLGAAVAEEAERSPIVEVLEELAAPATELCAA